MTGLWIVLGIVAVLIVVGIVIYNGLISSRQRVEEAWSDITVQLKRRYDLIPNLIETVKGYAAQEKTVFQNVTEARSNAMNAQDPKAKAQAENMLSDTLKSLFAVSEAYPDLKSNQNFQALQDELVDTEDKIQAARRFYNGSARDLNIKIQTFPNVLVARPFGFSEREFFEVDESEAKSVSKPVGVKF